MSDKQVVQATEIAKKLMNRLVCCDDNLCIIATEDEPSIPIDSFDGTMALLEMIKDFLTPEDQ